MYTPTSTETQPSDITKVISPSIQDADSFSGPNSIGALLLGAAERQTTGSPAQPVNLEEMENVVAPTNSDLHDCASRPEKPSRPKANRAPGQMHPKGEIALSLVRAGFLVTPLGADGSAKPKSPFMPNWPRCPYSSKNKKALRERWSEENYNIGLVMGPQPNGSHLLAVDVDVKGGAEGAKSLAKLETLYDLPTNGLQTVTPSGGRHLFFRTKRSFGNTVAKMAGIDLRSAGGQVVAPGSTIDGKPYVKIDGPIPDLPADAEALFDSWRKHASRLDFKTPLGEKWDEPDNIERAIHYLEHDAPEAISSVNGNNATYQTACGVKDFQITPHECVSLMLEHYNPRLGEQWTEDDLAPIVASAYKTGSLPPGIADPRGELPNVEKELAEIEARIDEQPLTFAGTAFDPNFDFSKIPPRDWLVDKFLCRRYVTGLVSPGGAGKTQLACQLCVALPLAREDIVGLKIKASASVWYWCQEDDRDELHRRVGAAIQKFGADQRQLGGKLWLDSGVARPLLLAVRNSRGQISASKYVQPIVDFIRANKIDVLIVDPLVEFHEAEENNNVEMKRVIEIFRQIAQESDCAVLVAVHTRKPSQASSDGHAGNPDSVRGAGSQTNTFRVQYTLANMSESDRKRWRVPENERLDYVRLDDSKANLFKLGSIPGWYKRVSVALGGDGEHIGVLEPVALTESQNTDALEIVAKTIAAGAGGLVRGKYYPLADLIDKMSVSEKAVFGSPTNRSRIIATALDGPGWLASADDTHVGDTAYGRLHVRRKQGRGGTQLRLDAVVETQATAEAA